MNKPLHILDEYGLWSRICTPDPWIPINSAEYLRLPDDWKVVSINTDKDDCVYTVTIEMRRKRDMDQLTDIPDPTDKEAYAKYVIEIVTAWGEGKTIQWYDADEKEWGDVIHVVNYGNVHETFVFDFRTWCYRIKPEPPEPKTIRIGYLPEGRQVILPSKEAAARFADIHPGDLIEVYILKED